ncbi:MAG: hypothetical protein J7M14_06515, partial [Planctomycetes bacterium]|nr:hypothetical protein [Planctomycetota bacterium]
DTDIEPTETVVLTLAGGNGYVVGSPNNATVTIIDNDTPTITISATDDIAAADGADSGTFTLTRDLTGGTVVVNYDISGTAVAGDYSETLSGSVTMVDGAASADITVTPVNDLVLEGDETLTLTLVDGVDYIVGWPDSDTLTILDKQVIPGDTESDYDVDATDLAQLGVNWSPSPSGKDWTQGDFDGDGDVDASDLAALGLNWSPGGYGVPEAPAESATAFKGIAGADSALPAAGEVELSGASVASVPALMPVAADTDKVVPALTQPAPALDAEGGEAPAVSLEIDLAGSLVDILAEVNEIR